MCYGNNNINNGYCCDNIAAKSRSLTAEVAAVLYLYILS